jgi:hypothetical protein
MLRQHTWKSFEQLTIHLVSHPDLDFCEIIENIELSKVEGIIAID